MDGRIVQRRWWVAAGQGRRSGGDMFLSGEASAGNDPWSKPWKHWDAPGADKRGTGDGSGARRVPYCVPPPPCGGLCCLLPVAGPSALALALPPGARSQVEWRLGHS